MLESLLDLHYLLIFVAGAVSFAALTLSTRRPGPSHQMIRAHTRFTTIPADGATP